MGCKQSKVLPFTVSNDSAYVSLHEHEHELQRMRSEDTGSRENKKSTSATNSRTTVTMKSFIPGAIVGQAGCY